MLITLAFALSWVGQDVPAERLTYPAIPLERDPLAPLPEIVEEVPAEHVAEAPVAASTCPTRMFEAPMVLVGPGGSERATNVILCANSDSHSDYETMLKSARSKILFDENFTLASRAAFMEQVDAELTTLDEMDDPSVEAIVPVGR